MLMLLSVLSLALPGQLQTSSAAGVGGPSEPRLRAQESTLPARTFGAGLSLGVVAAGPITEKNVPLVIEPTGSVTFDWSPLDWLQVSFLRPGVSLLLGTRGQDEVVLSGGLEGYGYHSVEGLLLQPGARAAWRHWFGPRTSLALVGGWASFLSNRSTTYAIDGGVLFTHTIRERVSVNVAAGALGWPTQSLGVTLGSGRIGLRTLPLVRVHVTPAWSVDLDAQVRLQVQPFVASSQQVLVGFTAAW